MKVNRRGRPMRGKSERSKEDCVMRHPRTVRIRSQATTQRGRKRGKDDRGKEFAGLSL